MLAKCQHNALNALFLRHLSAPPNLCTAQLSRSLLTALGPKLKQCKYHVELEKDEWKARRTLAKLKSIEESIEQDRLQLGKAKSFVKREVTTSCPTKARLIQGNENEATAYRDPDMFRAIADACKNIAFEEGGIKFDLHYTSGLNNDSLSELLNSALQKPGNHVFDERDGKNWDSTMQRPHMEFEAAVYALADELLAEQHLIRSSSVRGVIRMKDAIIKYTSAWKRLSGDWNTSVGNTLISMAILTTVLLALPENMRPKSVMGMFLGDDYLGVYTYEKAPPPLRELNALLKSAEEACGITPVRGMTDDVLLVEYTSLGVWPRYDGGVQFVPKISNMLVKLFHSTQPLSRHTANDVVATIKALQPSFSGLFFMEEFLSWHLRLWRGHIARPASGSLLDAYALNQLTKTNHRINWNYGFIHKFRIPVTMLNCSLPPVDRVRRHVFYLESPVVNQLYALEHADPNVRLTS